MSLRGNPSNWVGIFAESRRGSARGGPKRWLEYGFADIRHIYSSLPTLAGPAFQTIKTGILHWFERCGIPYHYFVIKIPLFSILVDLPACVSFGYVNKAEFLSKTDG